MDWSSALPYAFPATVLTLAVVARVCGDLSTQKESKQSSRVQRIEGTVSRVAADIVTTMMQTRSTGSPADIVTAVKSAAVSQGADYMLRIMPDTIKASGATRDSLIAMLSGEVSRQHIIANAPALLTAAAAGLLPAAQSSPSPAPSDSPAAAAG